MIKNNIKVKKKNQLFLYTIKVPKGDLHFLLWRRHQNDTWFLKTPHYLLPKHNYQHSLSGFIKWSTNIFILDGVSPPSHSALLQLILDRQWCAYYLASEESWPTPQDIFLWPCKKHCLYWKNKKFDTFAGAKLNSHGVKLRIVLMSVEQRIMNSETIEVWKKTWFLFLYLDIFIVYFYHWVQIFHI